MLIVCAALLPAVLLFSWMIWRSDANERSAMERRVMEDTESMARLVDSVLDTRIAVLRTLATARSLEAGDLRDFHARATRAVPGKTEWIVLADSRGTMVLHTEYPFGTELPDGAGEYLAVTASGKMFYSNLLVRGPATGLPVLFIALPVSVKGTKYSIHYVMTANVLSDVLAQEALPSDRVATLIDRDNRVLARNRRISDFVGAEATPRLRAELSRGSSGTLYDQTLDGVESVLAFTTSKNSGWTTIVAAPSAALFTPAREMLKVALSALVIVIAVAFALAAAFAARLVSSVEALVTGTKALATGDPSLLRETGMRETDHVVRAMRDAASQLGARQIELARSRDEAIEASRVKDEFLATLSHELRTPLNPVLLLASGYAVDPGLSPEMRAVFETVAKGVSLEARLIDDMLDMTRIAQGKLRLEVRTIDLHEVLRDTFAAVDLDFADKQIQLETDFGAEPAWVSGDPVRLQQIFWNLLKNAAKFSPARGRVQIGTRLVDEKRAQVYISDCGIGMTAEELSRGFQRFRQGGHGLGGLGLGLSISHALAEAHGGILTATSAGRDQGATFTVELPTVPPPMVDSETIQPESAARRTAETLSVLLVEDHEPSKQVLRRLLMRRGYEVVTAGSVSEALEIYRTGEFNLLVSDIGLPDGDGYTLLQKLLAIRPVVAIALSGYGRDEDLQLSRSAGFVDHLIKPVTMDVLTRALKKAQSRS